jgi:polysaccharide pyruvyl transferase CsaB
MALKPLAKRHKRIILNGYYGFDNFGDELILLSLIRLFQHYGFDITVISQNPTLTRQRYGVSAVGRYNLLQLLATFLRSHGFISGGGGLLQDSTGPNSVLYYGGMMAIARVFGLKTLHAFTSVGPIEAPLMRQFAGMALKCCQLVLVRDAKSVALVEALSDQRPMETADAVWLLPPVDLTIPIPPNPMTEGTDCAEDSSTSAESETPTAPVTETKQVLKGKVWRVALSLRPHKRFSQPNQEALARLLSTLVSRAASQVQVELSFVACEDDMDVPFLEEFQQFLLSMMPERLQAQLIIKHVPQRQALHCFATSHWVLGMRYHALVASILNKRPVFALDYDPKVETLAAQLGLSCQRVDDIVSLKLEALLESIAPESPIDIVPLQKQVNVGFQAIRVLLESH